MGRWASFSTAGLCWVALVFWRHVQGRLCDLMESWADGIDGPWELVRWLSRQSMESMTWMTLKEKEISSIFCDACRRFAFPPVVRAPMNLNVDCPAGCTHTQNYCHCKFYMYVWLICSSIFLSVCYFSPYDRFACAVEWLILAKLLGYTWLFPGCLA